MTVMYVKETGAVVRRDAERIKVTHRPPQQRVEKELDSIAVRDLEQLVLCGNVQLTTQAATLLLEHDVDVIFLSHYGKFRGRLSQSGSKMARLRHAQLLLSGDAKRALPVAGAIVAAKLSNQRNLLQRLATQVTASQAAALASAAQGIVQMRQASPRAATLDALRGFEGKAGVYYFGAIKQIMDPRWNFQGRAYHPSPDPLNALLSFGYGLLQKDVTATSQIVGLDPFLGCFHALDYGRPSLTLDLMEEFRPLMVDEPFLLLALGGRLTPQDFVFTHRPERPVELDQDKIGEVIKAYETRANQTVFHAPSRSQQTLRRCLERQARIFASVALGSRQEYEGLVV